MKNDRLVNAALKVIEAWHDYVDDDGQMMPAKLCDEPEIIDELCAAVSEVTGKEVSRMPSPVESTP